MNLKSTRLAELIVIAGLVAPTGMYATESRAEWAAGNDDRNQNHGRFAGWPITVSGSRFYEQDLLFRIYPDGLERAHKSLAAATWRIGFGWAQRSDDVTAIAEHRGSTQPADIFTTDVTWTSKTFAVRRRFTNGAPVVNTLLADCGQTSFSGTYLVRTTTVAPAVWVSSPAACFYVKYRSNFAQDSTRTGFSHVFFPTTAGALASLALPASGRVSMPGNWDRAGASRNWLLLVGEQNALETPTSNCVLPLMVSFPPGDVDSLDVVAGPDTTSYLRVHLADRGGAVRNIALSMPFGARGFYGPATNWQGALSNGAVVLQCDVINGMACNVPTVVLEDFEDFASNPTAGTIQIRNTFSGWQKLHSACSTVRYASYPPMVGLAIYSGLQDVQLLSSAAYVDYPCKYAPVSWYVPNDTVCVYAIPSAPRFDVHALRTGTPTEYQAMAEQMLNHTSWATHQHTNGVFQMMNNHGEGYALGLVSQAARDRYLLRMHDTIKQLMDEAMLGHVTAFPEEDAPDLGDVMPLQRAMEGGVPPDGMPHDGWNRYTVPLACGAVDTVLVTLQKNFGAGAFPFDMDAGAGAILEYVYEYML